MLGAQGGEEEGDDSLLQGITRGSFQGIMQDRLSSHVMEVRTCPHTTLLLSHILLDKTILEVLLKSDRSLLFVC